MWKRILAVCCLPVAIIFSGALVYSTLKNLLFLDHGTGGQAVGYVLGTLLGVALLGGLLFFLWRWILRTLGKNKDEQPPGGPVTW